MSEIEEIQRYIDRTKIDSQTKKRYCMCIGDFYGLYGRLGEDVYDALRLAFDYGQAKGYRAAKAEKIV